MTVKELIEILKEFDDDIRVMQPGYEGGYDDIERADIYDMCLNVHPEHYYGDHDILGAWGVDEDEPTILAVVIH